MKITLGWAFLPLMLGSFWPQAAQAPATGGAGALQDPCLTENRAFQAGEELTYKIYYNWNFVWLSAGEVTFKVVDKGDAYHLSAVGRTYSSYEWFFKVRDTYESYVDKGSLLPRKSLRNVDEGGFTIYDLTTYEQGRRAVSLHGSSPDKAKRKEVDLRSCVHDVVSVIYYARNLEYERYRAGQTFPANVFIDQTEYPLQVKYEGKSDKTKVKDLGDFRTISFRPQVLEGNVFDGDSELKIWASDDANRLPLVIESGLRVGSIKAVLKSHKNLKHPLAAKR